MFSSDLALCKRTLYDRFGADRKAIFGQSFANLRAGGRIEFALHGETIGCDSEEEVASAQPRLQKDHVDDHADQVYTQWRQTDFESERQVHVVVSVVQLFRCWDLLARK